MKRRNLFVIILVALWLLGLVTSHTMGGGIHALPIIAVMVVLFNITNGRTNQEKADALDFPEFLR